MLLVPSSVTRKYYPKVLELLHLQQRMATFMLATLLRISRETYNSVLLVLISIPTWLHAAENQSSAY